MLNNDIKERLRMLMWREDETRPDVVLAVVAKFTASSMQVREPGVKVWQWPWASGAAILSRNWAVNTAVSRPQVWLTTP